MNTSLITCMIAWRKPLKVFLDDVRKPPTGWELAITASYCIKLLERNDVTAISLDHDLGLEDENGYDVLLWIEEQVFTENYIPPEINIHTSNPSARLKMKLASERIIKKATSGD